MKQVSRETRQPGLHTVNSKPYKFVVRLPESMRSRIADAASAARRSINSEILARLESSFQMGAALPGDGPEPSANRKTVSATVTADELDMVYRYRRSDPDRRAAIKLLLD